MSDKFEKWWESLELIPDHKELAKLAYDEGWTDGDYFQLECHKDYEKERLERLRDQFATAAMPAILSRLEFWCDDVHDISALAYRQADSMLEERIKKQE